MKTDYFIHIPIRGRVRACIDLLESQNIKDKIIIDIGSSFGWLEKIIATKSAKKIIGIEPSASALAFAKKHVEGVEFLYGDAGNITVKDNYADIVLLFDVLEHVPPGSEPEVFTQIYRILKPNGVLLLSTPHSNLLINLLDPAWYFGHRHYRVSTLQHLARIAHFNIISLNIKGGILSSIYLIIIYILKMFLGEKVINNKLLGYLDELGYTHEKIGTVFMVAQKKQIKN